MIHASKTLVIIGSVRPVRLCPHIAAWVAQVGREILPGQLELVDLREWNLPLDGEPGVPAAGGDYVSEPVRAWSRKVSEAQGVVFVTPQYNWGYPAALKNALDHLYREWTGKPAMIVTYGGHGGGKCGEQLRQVLDGLKMKPVETMPSLTLRREQIVANTGSIDPATQFADAVPTLREAFAELGAALASL